MLENNEQASSSAAGSAMAEAQIMAIIEGLGGKANIKGVENCFTRLRVDVADMALVNEAKINETKNSGIVKRGNNVQIIYGLEVPQISKAVDEKLASL